MAVEREVGVGKLGRGMQQGQPLESREERKHRRIQSRREAGKEKAGQHSKGEGPHRNQKPVSVMVPGPWETGNGKFTNKDTYN